MLRYSLQQISRNFAFSMLLLTLSSFHTTAAPPTPELVCISVESNGSISLHWNIPSGTFDGFRIYYRQISAPPFPAFASQDFGPAETNGIIPVNDAMNVQYEVFMNTYEGTTPSADSKTLRTIKPIIIPVAGETGIANITWNALHQDFTGIYKIFRSTDNTNYVYINETNGLTYLDTIQGVCVLTTFYYRIEFESATCTSGSMTGISTAELKDENPPKDPVFTYITINEQGFAELNWTESSSSDVARYQFEVKEGISFSEHTSIEAPATTFTDDHDELTNYPHYQNPCNQIVTYVIKAVDSCGTSSAEAVYTAARLHNTIWLRVESESNCNRKATLTWNRYNNLNPAVSEYQIMRSQNGDAPVEIQKITTDNSTEYTFTDNELLTPGDSYTYYVRATNNVNNFISESCRITIVPDPEQVETFDLDNVTVTDNNHIDLTLFGTPLAAIDKIEILRSETNTTPMQPILTLEWNNTSQVIPENSARIDSTAYYYQARALDACGFEVATSKIFRSIYLQISDMGEGSFRLNWNEFEGWESDLSGYNVYCFLNDQMVEGFPVFLSPGNLVYNDPSPDVEGGKITYYVEALRNDLLTSRSNMVLLVGEPEIMMPTAFTPDGNGLNDTIVPIAKNIETTNYMFTIYNRWGERIFQTGIYPDGWDGKIKGIPAPAGIYAYIINYSDYYGLSYTKRGKVILLR